MTLELSAKREEDVRFVLAQELMKNVSLGICFDCLIFENGQKSVLMQLDGVKTW